MSAKQNNWSAKRPLVAGFLTLAVLVFGIGAWSVYARIAGAIVAHGLMEVASSRQIVQHPDGGVVSEINVEDGDLVEAGDILLRLDATLLRSELAIVEGQLFEVMTRRARLSAEREGADEVILPEELRVIAIPDANVREMIAGQIRLFNARRTALTEEISQLNERIKQVLNQIKGWG